MKNLIKGIISIATISFIFIIGLTVGHGQIKQEPAVIIINLDEYHRLVETKKSFVLYIGRASCKNCAITSLVLGNCLNDTLPIYHLELEKYHQSPEYDEIKAELKIVYVPSFKYIEFGNIKYHMNSPLNGSYFSEDSNKQTILLETEVKIKEFIDGATGTGPVINEEVITNELKAEPLIFRKGEPNE